MKQKRLQAFSLIELSIVILIIGIVLAGVMQATSLVRKMKVTTARSLTQSSAVNSIDKLSLWLETTSLSSFPVEYSDGNPVTQWNDINPQSTQKINFVPSSTAPLFKNSKINGLPAVVFSNTQITSQRAISIGDLVAADQISLFVVWNNYSTSSQLGSVISAGASPNRINIHAPWGSDGKVYFDFGNPSLTSGRTGVTAPVLVSSDTNSTPIILSFIKNGGSMEARVNGKTPFLSSGVATDVVDTSASITPSLFPGYYADVAEIIIFSKGLKSDERQDVEKYLSQKYAIKLG